MEALTQTAKTRLQSWRGVVRALSLTLLTVISSGALAIHAQEVSAASDIDLIPSLPLPQTVGTKIIWTGVGPSDEAAIYRLSVGLAGDSPRVMYDFGPGNVFDWTTIEEGTYRVVLSMRGASSGEATHVEKTFVIKSRVGRSPIVTPTVHPLVALYSAPPCEAGEMRVIFVRLGSKRPYSTNSKPCKVGHSVNFYIAGMRAESVYLLQHRVFDESGLLEQGPNLLLRTGKLPENLPSFLVSNPADLQTSLKQPVTVHFPAREVVEDVCRCPVATDLSGEIIWYYQPTPEEDIGSHTTRVLEGGNMLRVESASGFQGQVLREVDLLGNTVRMTNTFRINQYLDALGFDPISGIHHEVVRFPNGYTLAIAGVERIIEDAQGPGAVDVLGDMVIALT